MTVNITGRHIEITEPIRKFTTDRLDRLRPIIDEVMEAHFILTVEKHQRHIAEVNIKTRHELHHSTEESSDMYTSIAAAVDKVEKQILRSKGKKVDRKRKGEHLGIVAASAVEAEADLGEKLPRIIKTHEVAAKPLSVDDAAVELDTAANGFVVFRNSENQRINVVYKRKDGNVGWIEPEA